MAAAFAPEAVLGEVDGICVVFGALLATSTGVVIYLYAPRNEVTDALDASYETAFQDWASQADPAMRQGERHADPPQQPPTVLMNIPLVLSDDVRTPYRCSQKAAGGTGTEWEATWRFQPAIAKRATRLTVAIETDDCRAQACALPL